MTFQETSYNRRAAVLLITLVIILLATMMVVTLVFRSRAAELASTAGVRHEQARAAAMSGIRRAIAVLKAYPTDTSKWLDNPEWFKDQLVVEDSTGSWYFTIYAPSETDPDSVRYGVIDEAGKVNLNIADEKALLSLPGMTQELVDCLMDWRDPDSEPRGSGAEDEYYQTLQPIAYSAKNGPMLTVEELLLVKGFTGSIVYGEDANLNGLLDANEDDGDESFPPDDGDGVLNRGLLHHATAMTYETDVDNTGQPRINLNGDDTQLNKLASIGLPNRTVIFIKTVRSDGGRFIHPAQLLNMKYTLRKQQGRYKAGSKLSSGVGTAQMPIVMDKLTTRSGRSGGEGKPARPAVSMGLLNINSASQKALASLGEIDDNLAQQIVDERASLDPEQRATTAWLLTQGLVDQEQFMKIAPKITARSMQFRVRCIGYQRPGGQHCVLEAIIDIARGAPRMYYVRDITRLGVPMALDADETVLSGGS